MTNLTVNIADAGFVPIWTQFAWKTTNKTADQTGKKRKLPTAMKKIVWTRYDMMIPLGKPFNTKYHQFKILQIESLSI